MEYSRSTEFMPYVASLKNPVILKQVDDEALLFTGDHQVKPFCIAHGFDNATRSWAAGEYFSSLLNATITFEKQNGTLAYVYTLDHEDIFPLLEEQGLEPSAKNVRALMRDTDDLSDMSDYFSENICNANWISDEIDNAKDFLDQKGDSHSKTNAVGVRNMGNEAQEASKQIAREASNANPVREANTTR